jgi:ankyrin repeat protein
MTALHRAALDGDLRTVKAAIAAGQDLNVAASIPVRRWDYLKPITYETKATPLDLAIRGNRVEVVRELLGAGAKLNLGGVPYAIAQGEEMSRALLEGGLGANTTLPHMGDWLDGGTPLHWAVYYEQPGTTKLLLDKGADPNARDEMGHTPLMAFWWHGGPKGPEVARLLLATGADPNAEANPYQGAHGIVRETPLNHARDFKRHDIEAVLAQAAPAAK